jgi:hypothetical protein
MEKKKKIKGKIKEKEMIPTYDEEKVIELLENPETLPIAVQMLHSCFPIGSILTMLNKSSLNGMLCVQLAFYLFEFPPHWIPHLSSYKHIFQDRDVALSKKATPSLEGVNQVHVLIKARIISHEQATPP